MKQKTSLKKMKELLLSDKASLINDHGVCHFSADGQEDEKISLKTWHSLIHWWTDAYSEKLKKEAC